MKLFDGNTKKEYQEILVLDEMLTEKGIPHTLKTMYDGWQVICLDENNTYVLDVVEHGMTSHGYDLLEIMYFKGIEHEETVIGGLTADDVMKIIEEVYGR